MRTRLRLSIAAIAVLIAGIASSSGLAAETRPSLDQRLLDAAERTPDRIVQTIVSFDDLRPIRDANVEFGASVRIASWFHGFRGAYSDYVGGYLLPVGSTLSEAELVTDYDNSQREMLVAAVAEITEQVENADISSAQDALAWQHALEDARARLDDYEAHGLRVFGAVVEGRAVDVISLAGVRSVRRIDRLTERGIPLLPWESKE
jgi:hypothetical protein